MIEISNISFKIAFSEANSAFRFEHVHFDTGKGQKIDFVTHITNGLYWYAQQA